MKKKILALCLVVALAATGVVGASMAYLTDTDDDVNVMTLGNVQIEQHEYQRATNEDGTYKTDTIDNVDSYVLEEFDQGKPLYPFVGDVMNGYDSTPVRLSQLGHNSRGGMEVFPAKNVVDKFVVVENTGKNDAYVRTIVAFEAGSVAEEDWNKLVNYSFHFTWKQTQDWFVTEINGNNYYMVEFVYNGYEDIQHPNGVLTPGDYTYNSLAQVYLFDTATNEDVEALDGNDNGTYDILVLSQAVQADGFADAQTALDTAFGGFNEGNVKAWFGGTVVPVYVTEDVNSTGTGYGFINAVDETTIVNGANIVTEGGVNVQRTVIFNSGSVVTNSTSTSSRHVFYVWPGGNLTINGGEFTFSPSNLTRKGYYICADGEGAIVIVNGGTFHKPSTRSDGIDYTVGIGELNGGEVIIYGGTFAFDPSNWVADGYQAVESDGWWTVSAQ